MVAEIIINSNVKNLNRVFDYIIPLEYQDKAAIGSRVLVPFGNKKELEEGFIVGIKETSEYINKLKEIAKVEDKLYLSKEKITLAKWMAGRYFCNISDCIKLMLPPGTTTKVMANRVNEILIEFPKEEQEEIKEEEGEVNMQMDYNNISVVEEEQEEVVNKFEKYDDMTLFNKVILSLNTKEERLTRNEEKLKQRKEEIEERLSLTNKNIEANIERENELTQRKMDLNSKEIELNAKLSETEVILLNIKPLIKGLNKIKESDLQGGASNE